jgi:hypothetical protein
LTMQKQGQASITVGTSSQPRLQDCKEARRAAAGSVEKTRRPPTGPPPGDLSLVLLRFDSATSLLGCCQARLDLLGHKRSLQSSPLGSELLVASSPRCCGFTSASLQARVSAGTRGGGGGIIGVRESICVCIYVRGRARNTECMRTCAYGRATHHQECYCSTEAARVCALALMHCLLLACLCLAAQLFDAADTSFTSRGFFLCRCNSCGLPFLPLASLHLPEDGWWESR